MEPAGPTLFSAPVSEFQPRLHFPPFLHQADRLGPRLDFFLTPSTPFSALMRVLLLPTPVNFVLRTRVKFTCSYPVSMRSVFRAVCLMFRDYMLCLGTEITVCFNLCRSYRALQTVSTAVGLEWCVLLSLPQYLFYELLVFCRPVRRVCVNASWHG